MTWQGPSKVRFLGSGPSSGVPGIGVGWGKCNPDNPKNERTRQSLLVEHADRRFLIDTTPDLRTQLLREDINAVDAVLYTHAHADHLNGLDDLRGINKFIKKPLPVFADPNTHKDIAERFGYALAPLPDDDPGYFVRPVLQMNEFSPGDEIEVSGLSVGTFLQDHGFSSTVGFKFGSIVYSTDVKMISDEILDELSTDEIDVWIIGVFQWKEHWTHAHVDLALEWIDRVKPKRAILTHLGINVDFDELAAATPQNVEPAFDGMTVDLSQNGGEIIIS